MRAFRLDGHRMLEMLRGKRMVFVGDSLNRNMWESLVCILRNSVKDKRKVYEANGRVHFRGEAFYSFIFEVSVHFFCLFCFSSCVFMCIVSWMFDCCCYVGVDGGIGLQILRGVFCITVLSSRMGGS